jgi:hypothetical protein
VSGRPSRPATLVLEPSVGGDDGSCLDLSTDPAAPTSLLSVLYTDSVDERTARLREREDGIAAAAFVAVDPVDPPDGTDAIRGIASATDLTGVGVAVTEWVGARDPGENPVVCIEGLSTLLQYVETEQVFRFLHAVRGHCRDNGVNFHAHLTPSAHDDQTVATLAQIFDERRRVGAASVDDGTGDRAADPTAVTTDAGSDREVGR